MDKETLLKHCVMFLFRKNYMLELKKKQIHTRDAKKI